MNGKSLPQNSGIVELSHLAKTYKKDSGSPIRAVDDVSLSVKAGEFVAILGPSGSGKSSLMSIMGLLDRPDGGTYRLAGEDVSGMSELKLAHLRSRLIGFVFQSFHLLPRTTAVENVQLALLYANCPDYRERGERALDAVGLSKRKNHFVSELSGGEQQRVAIARAIANQPKLILADEPTGNLDSNTQAGIMALFKEQHRNGATIVLITHNVEVAEVADRIIRVRDGRIESDERVERVERGVSAPALN